MMQFALWPFFWGHNVYSVYMKFFDFLGARYIYLNWRVHADKFFSEPRFVLGGMSASDF